MSSKFVDFEILSKIELRIEKLNVIYKMNIEFKIL